MSSFFANLNVWWIAAATFAALAMGTAMRLAALPKMTDDVARERRASLKTWWVLAILVLAAGLLGRTALVLLFSAVSILSLREFLALGQGIKFSRRLLVAAYLLVLLNYLWIWLGWLQVFAGFLPLASIGVFSTLILSRREGFLREVAHATWGLLVTVYCLAHAVLLVTLPPESNPVAGPIGWFFLLVILTAMNDIAQALVGRRIGKRKITPRISPNKTWEGFCGGLVTTLVLAIVLAQWLTPFNWPEALLAGLVISLAGFFGDLNMSAVKRGAGVKDSGRLLPGQGGILDRIDSLTFSAPALYYLVRAMADVGPG